ncbi:hypothetical protein MMPV_006560 [Pyropia vietnamensis]
MPSVMDGAGRAESHDSPLEGILWPGGAIGTEAPPSANSGMDESIIPVGEDADELPGLPSLVYRDGCADAPAMTSPDTPQESTQALTNELQLSPSTRGSPDSTKARRLAKPKPAHVTNLPLLGPTVNSRSLVLAAATDASLDLTGDVGQIGRFGAMPPPGTRGIQVDLKGTLYDTARSRINTALVVNIGADAANVVAAFHEVLWLIPQEGGDAAADHLSGEEEEDDLADHQMFYSAGRAGAGGGIGGSSFQASAGEEGQEEVGKGNGGGGAASTKRGGKVRKRARGGGTGASATPRKRSKRISGSAA